MNAEYCCTKFNCNRQMLVEREDGLHCPNGHLFPYIQQTNIPLFAYTTKDVSEYAHENAVNIHDNALQWVFDTFKTNESTLRNNLISRLHLSKGNTVLITGAGAGNDLPYLVQHLKGAGTIYAQDISQQMLMVGAKRHSTQLNASGVNIYFSVSDATNLPFSDDFFDAAYHFGGINLFSCIQSGIAEMNRVVKSGGRVVIGDEGVAPWLKQTETGKMLINNNPLYAYDAPLSLLPNTATSVNLSWELSNCFYVIEFTVSNTLLPIDIDVPHIGKRGGSIRTRSNGQLEGIDPHLREQIYAKAERLGMSRVEYLEALLKKSLSLF